LHGLIINTILSGMTVCTPFIKLAFYQKNNSPIHSLLLAVKCIQILHIHACWKAWYYRASLQSKFYFCKCGWLKDKKQASSVAEQNYAHRFQVSWEGNFETACWKW